jgi:hypothetical protein
MRRIYYALALVVSILVVGAVLASLLAPVEAQVTTIRATFSISGGDAIAPHLYVWYFNGIDAYILIPASSTLPTKPWSILGWFSFPSDAPDNRVFVQKNPDTADYDYGLKMGSYGSVLACFKDTNGVERCAYENINHKNSKWYHFAGTYDGVNYLRLYTNGSLDLTLDVTGLNIKTSSTGMSIAYGLNGYSKFYARNVLVYSAAVTSTDITNAYSSNIIRSANLVLFLDPSFYNGSHYKDASAGGNVGIAFGGVSRVRDSAAWLYLIKSRFTDNYIHFMFFPYGTRISVYDSSNNLVSQFTISGTANGADLVEDYPVALSSGTYTIVAELPPVTVTTTTFVTNTITNTVTETQTVTETETQTVTETETHTVTETDTVTETQMVTETQTLTSAVTTTTTTITTVPVTFTSTVTSTSYYAVPMYRTTTVIETVTVAFAGVATGWAVIIVALSIIGLAVAFLIAKR